MVTIGIDTHKATLAVSAIDATGRETGARTFPNDRQGHVGLLRWAQAHGSERRFGIEGSGSYGAALGRLLVAAGERVVEVPAVLTDRERRHLRRAGKSDPGDALAIARVALRALVVPISYWVLALLVENGIAPYDQTHALFDLLGLLGWISLFLLGPIGIVIAGRSAGVRGALAWLALLIVAIPVLAFVWFVCVATLSGALGNPF
jgi:Transposase